MPPANAEIIHASCLALVDIGVLLLGPSGSGKSDLALRLIDQPGLGMGCDMMTAMLVADDRVLIQRRQNKLFAAPAETIKGLLEIRGQGVFEVPYIAEIEVGLVVELTKSEDIDRLPASDIPTYKLAGIDLPKIKISPFETSSPAKIRTYISNLMQESSHSVSGLHLSTDKS